LVERMREIAMYGLPSGKEARAKLLGFDAVNERLEATERRLAEMISENYGLWLCEYGNYT
jgi:hypothetical protein